MNMQRLYAILNETTVQLRKGDVVRENGNIVTIDMMPHEDEAGDDLARIDCFFLTIGVDKAKAEEHRAEFIGLLDSYPDMAELAGGPSYVAVGATIGDQGAAFQLFALGAALGLWTIITPKTFGLDGEEANRAAGSGFIMMSGYRPAKSEAAA